MFEEISSLPIEKKIGQLFFIGLQGAEIDSVTSELLKKISPGGICLFSRNIRSPQQVRKLLDDASELLPATPFLSLDQEGGQVDRLRRINAPMPPASAVTNSIQVDTLAKITGEILRILGFNMNFAPVVDVLTKERKQSRNGLYSRIFGGSKEEVVEFTNSYITSLQEKGCLGCIKHFPGLGASEIDSHENLPIVNVEPEDFFSTDLFVYENLLQISQIKAVMVAHATYPQIDLQETDSNGKLLPSSLSQNFVKHLLKERLSFKGLVLTDDLEMGAIVNNYEIGEACKLAVLAGEDMLLICAGADSVRRGYATVLEAVKNGEISEERINESLERIAHLKSLIQKPLPFDINRLQILSENTAELNKQLNYRYGG